MLPQHSNSSQTNLPLYNTLNYQSSNLTLYLVRSFWDVPQTIPFSKINWHTCRPQSQCTHSRALNFVNLSNWDFDLSRLPTLTTFFLDPLWLVPTNQDETMWQARQDSPAIAQTTLSSTILQLPLNEVNWFCSVHGMRCWIDHLMYRVIQNDCRGFNNLSYTTHLR